MRGRVGWCGVGAVGVAMAALAVPVSAQRVSAGGSQGTWDLLDGRHAVETVAGKEAFVLRPGPQLVATDLSLENGEVTFSMRFTENARFGGISFRRGSDREYQTIYLRPRNSERWDALQYQVIFDGSSSWQLYSEFNAEAEIPVDEWIPVRLVLDGPRLALHLHGETEPTLVVPRARGRAAGGPLGFWASNWDPDGELGVAVADVQVMERAGADPIAPPPTPGPGVLRHWQISEPVATAPEALPLAEMPEVGGWRPVGVEEGGLVNLSREVGAPSEGIETVAARTTLHADRAAMVPLDIGYSNWVTVLLNGRPIYSGYDDWEGRYPGYFGGIRSGFETVWLPLERGDNELVLLVSEELTFGWGFRARLDSTDGVREAGR